MLRGLYDVLAIFLIQFLLQLYWVIKIEFAVSQKKHINIEINVDKMLGVNFRQRHFKDDIWLKIKIELMYVIKVVSLMIKQRWNNVDWINLFRSSWTNFGSTLMFGSHLMSINVVSTLIKPHWNNVKIICCSNFRQLIIKLSYVLKCKAYITFF